MRFGRLDLNLLVALDALLTECSVSLAADRLCLSQSATSSALGRLRDYFGDELLVVRGRSMVLTARAESLVEPVRAVLEQVRAQGWAARVDGSMPGVSALATPVFDGFGAMVLALVAIGPSAALPVDAASPLLAPLQDAAEAISRRIGWRG